MNSALSAFMVSRKSRGQMEMRPRVQERGQLQQKGATEAMGKMSLLREMLLHEQNDSITILRNGQRKDHLRCRHHHVDDRGLALSDLLETRFYL